MRIFVTGATGFVGSAIVKELLCAGYEVIGLARSESAANALTAASAKVQLGDLQDFDSLRNGAASADAVIHTAFNHDFSKFKNNCEMDRQAIEVLGSALIGTDRPFIITSAIGILPQGQLATEDIVPLFGPTAHFRVATEEAATQVLNRGVHVSVIRLAPTVHGKEDHNFIPTLINIAREKGTSAYIGDGSNCWPAIHRLDAALLYRLVLEKGTAGKCYHAVSERGIPFKEIAEAIGQQLNLSIVSITKEESLEHFGWFAHFAAMNIPASSQWTKEQLDWEPTHPGLLEDISYPHYFIE